MNSMVVFLIPLLGLVIWLSFFSKSTVEQKKPDLKDDQIKKEVVELITQKNKFDFNRGLLEKIQNKEFTENDFLNLGN
ncbi:MAG: hypothetical protein P8L77_03150, partial [Gammaproteobacteria bacterium]|nr:hypothetical protein [Gammaproteobacteria bacterium]